MDWHKQTIRVGTLAVVTAMLLRFVCSDIFGSALGIFQQPELASFLIYTETGRRPVLSDESTVASTETTAAPTLPEPTQIPPTTLPPPPQKPSFTQSDTRYFDIQYSCTLRPDTKKLLLQRLDWDLTGDKPAILIIHTHGTEAYTPTADTQYDAHAAFRTTDSRYNVISMGDELARLLEEEGLAVIHDRTAFDKNDYINAYDNARKAVQAYMKEYPTIRLVLDLHRDAAEYADGTQWATSATVNGQASAQLMFVVGTDAWGLKHPQWQTNLSVAEKLTVLMEKNASGICRPIDLRGQRFNHDLAPGALIVEVGSAGNTHPEALRAIPILAKAIVQLAGGAGCR
jgi:stage II sporulation protein P